MNQGLQQFSKTCTCCGELRFPYLCDRCQLPVCGSCISIGLCLLCMAKDGFIMTQTQRKQLESVYSQGGFQFEKAHNKFANLK
jgi:hypothetical protein